MKTVNYRIRQELEETPVYIQMFCPLCAHENKFIYSDLEAEYGSEPRWLTGKIINCQSCKLKMEFGDY